MCLSDLYKTKNLTKLQNIMFDSWSKLMFFCALLFTPLKCDFSILYKTNLRFEDNSHYLVNHKQQIDLQHSEVENIPKHNSACTWLKSTLLQVQVPLQIIYSSTKYMV